MPRGTDKLLLSAEPGGMTEIANLAGIPTGRWATVKNFVSLEGVLKGRPGYDLMGSQLAAMDDIIGFGFRGTLFSEPNLVVHTISAAYEWDGSAFNAITGTWTTTSTDEHVRFQAFSQGGTVYLLRINPDNAIDEWNGTGNFTSTSGSPPAGIDIISAGGRVVVIKAAGDQDRIQWSGINDRTSWPSTNIALLRDTPGSLMAARSFAANSFAIYKDDSVSLGTVTGQTNPFQFQVVAHVAGPVSPSSVVSFEGKHFWFANDGNIYRFDGGRIRKFASDLSRTIRDTFDWGNRLKAHGMILPLTEPQLWFFYPDATNDGLLTRGLSVNINTEQQQIHEFAHSITASAAWTSQPSLTIDQLTGTIDDLDLQYSSIDAMGSAATRTSLVGESTGHVSRFNASTQDRGTDYSWELDSGWRAIGGVEHSFFMDGVQSYWTQEGSSKTVTVGLKVSERINDAETESTDTIDISSDVNHLVTFRDQRGKWARARFAGTGATTATAFRGGALLGWQRNMRGPVS